MQMQVTNIAGYQFIEIADVEFIHNQLQSVCSQTHLKGSIFISKEGINLSLAGSPRDIEFVLDFLHSSCRFSNLLINTTYSDEIPFKRLLIKIRDELVPTSEDDAPTINAHTINKPSYITSDELKQWLDDGYKFTLLDTRNSFEYELGSFDNAKHLGLKQFRQLQKAKNQLKQIPKDKPIITFCTGGIRCEKAAPFIQQQGFNQVYQLKGGILNYLNKYNDQHWHGDCFVFDDRISLNKELKPNYAKLCRSCQTRLRESEDRTCNHCKTLA